MAKINGRDVLFMPIVDAVDSGDSYYDTFWDTYQQNGSRHEYSYVFAGEGWREETFTPKYNIRPSNATGMFMNAAQLKIDLAEHLAKLGVTLDFSRATNMGNAFRYCYATRLGVIDTSNCSSLSGTFSYSKIVTIDKLILKEDGSQSFSNTFEAQTYLKNIIIEGVIGKAINFSACSKLTAASITSIMTALYAVSGDTRPTVTFSKTAVNKAFETAPGNNDGSSSAEFIALWDSRNNWNVSLI